MFIIVDDYLYLMPVWEDKKEGIKTEIRKSQFGVPNITLGVGEVSASIFLKNLGFEFGPSKCFKYDLFYESTVVMQFKKAGTPTSWVMKTKLTKNEVEKVEELFLSENLMIR